MGLFGRLLPRHLEIIYEINDKCLDAARIRFLGDETRVARLSLIDEHGERYIRMANLACVGSHAINGVAELHTELLKADVLRDFYELWPEKFSNKTNGVTPPKRQGRRRNQFPTAAQDWVGRSPESRDQMYS